MGRVAKMIIDSKQYNGMCTCGKEHKMTTLLSVIEPGCMKKIGDYLKEMRLDDCTAAIYDENTYRATADRHPATDHEVILDPKDLHADEHGVDMLMGKLPKGAKILIAVGSGTIHDLTRYCAYKNGLEFISCPTAASVDGFCSSVAAMTWHGCKKTLTAKSPLFVLADIDIIKNAPIRLAKSGFGDMIGKFIALTDWKISHILTGEFYCDRIAGLTLEATRKVLDSADGIMQGDESAYEALTAGLILSGLAMQMMGNSRPASGAEHHISHIIEMQPEFIRRGSHALHGEKVGVGTLIAADVYRKLAELPSPEFVDYTEFGDLREVFGSSLSDEIAAENSNDCAAGIKGSTIAANWETIRAELKKIPDPATLTALYERHGIKHTLSDIEADEGILDELIAYSPAVRNRVTMMRIKKCIH